MDMKGRWGKVIGWPLAVAALVGQSFIGYVTENGQLPPWMPEKLGGLASWLSTDVSIPVWSLVLILVCVGAVGTLFFKFQSRAPSGVDGRLAETTSLLEASYQRNYGLEESNSLLQQQLHELREASKKEKLQVPTLSFKVLTSIAIFTDAGIQPLLSHIETSVGGSKVEVHGAIDILSQHKLVQEYGTSHGMMYDFTPKGRAFYLEQKSQEEG
ncbi:hypothetical protein ACSFE6_04830 [Pseudomonas baetica]|uniref:hypothetical protein n=1 Tax=Pseudomonas baetica TaxID=674054 RepID=UPI003EEA7D65